MDQSTVALIADFVGRFGLPLSMAFGFMYALLHTPAIVVPRYVLDQWIERAKANDDKAAFWQEKYLKMADATEDLARSIAPDPPAPPVRRGQRRGTPDEAR